MHRFMVLAGCFCLIVATSAPADVPFEVHKATKLEFRFQGTEDFPDYVFFFSYWAERGQVRGTIVAELNGSGAIALGYSIANEHLIAIPRADYEARKSACLSILQASQWELIPGLVKWSVRGTKGKKSDYRVMTKNGNMSVEMVTDNSEDSGGEPKEWYDNRRWTWMVGCFVTLSVITTGIWLARRKRGKPADY